jgi:hypothetical protein
MLKNSDITKNGFALVGILVTIFIVAAIIFGSSFFWKKNLAPSPKKSIDTLQGAKADLGNINENLNKQNQEIKNELSD